MTIEIIETILHYAPAFFSALSTILAIVLMYKQGKLKGLISFSKTKELEDTSEPEGVSQRSYIDVMLELIKKTKTLTSYTVDERKLFVKSHIIIWAQTCGYKINAENLDSDIETYYNIMVG